MSNPQNSSRFADPGLAPTAPGLRAYVGGQAVLEGVMMRSPRALATAVRTPDGRIVIQESRWTPLFDRWPLMRRPLVRGVAVLVESMWNGLAALNFSARIAEGSPSEDAQAPAADSVPPDHSAGARGASMAFAFLVAVALFVGLPHGLAVLAGGLVGPEATSVRSPVFHVLDGVFKLTIFVGYIALIRRIPEIRRVFQYHGAEHKAVTTYEHGQALTVENARRFTTFHARCGTSFVLYVLALSIVLFAAVLPFVPLVSSVAWVNHVALVAFKLPLMLPVAGLAYELNRYAAQHPDAPWVQALVAPGRLMQSLTTAEPTDDQLEIALSAMRAALAREASLPAPSAAPRAVETPLRVFQTFQDVEAALPRSS